MDIEKEKSSAYGANLVWFLRELQQADKDLVSDGFFEVYGEDPAGNEGSCEVDISDLAKEAADTVEELRAKLAEMESQAKQLITKACCTAVEKLTELAPNQGWDSGEVVAEMYIRQLSDKPVPADKPASVQERAELIMGFVNQIAAAYEAGFTPYPHMTLQQLHRVAQHHVKDEFGIEVDDFEKSFGAELFSQCRAISESWEKPAVPTGKNRYGLDVGYLAGKLGLLVRDIENHKPDEAARVLARLSQVADESVLRESEFSEKPAVSVPCKKTVEMCARFLEGQRYMVLSPTETYSATQHTQKLKHSVNHLADLMRRTITPSHSQQNAATDAERFCDSHCTWRDHHPDCPSHES